MVHAFETMTVKSESSQEKLDRWKLLREGRGKGVEILRSRSSGRGGQNVNKVETRVTARLNVDDYPLFTEEDRVRLRETLGQQISKEGRISVSAQDERSQLQNETLAIERLIEKLERALEAPKERYGEKEPKKILAQKRVGKAKRLDEKRMQAKRKSNRQKVQHDERQ